MQGHGCRIGDIEAPQVIGRRDPHKAMAAFRCELAQSLALSAKDDCRGAVEGLVFKILYERDGDDFERSRCGFRQRTVEGRAVAPGRYDACGAEGGRRTKDGAHVVRVGYLIEKNEGALVGGRLGQFRKIGFGKRLRFEK